MIFYKKLMMVRNGLKNLSLKNIRFFGNEEIVAGNNYNIPRNKTVNIMHVNVQGILNKLNEIDFLLLNKNIDIMCISEHWVCSNNINNISFSDYKIMSHFSRLDHIHGGSLIMVNKTIQSYDIPSIKLLSVEIHIEICAVCININNKKHVVIVVYRPPDGNVDIFNINLTEALTIAFTISSSVVLCGDLNIDINNASRCANIILDIFESFELKISNTGPTRVFTNIHGHTSSSTIDYMVTNMPDNTYRCEIFNPHIADHKGHILSVIRTDDPSAKNTIDIIETRPINDNNIRDFLYNLDKINWAELYYLDVDESFQLFIENIIWCYNVSCPLRKIKVSNKDNNKGWLTNELIQQSKNLKNIFWLMITLETAECKILYKTEKNKLKHSIKTAKYNYNAKKIQDAPNKNKVIWNIVNTRLGRNKYSNNIKSLEHNGEHISDKSSMANAFASHFSAIAKNKLEQHFGLNMSLPCTTSACREQSMFFESITSDEVNKAIDKLNNKKSVGFDSLTSHLLKTIKCSIVDYLTYIFNLSIIHGHFPNILKQSIVVPLYKKGPSDEIESYRQISILSVVSKLLERIVYDRIASYCEKNRILTIAQHGFREGKSTETACFRFLEYVYESLDTGKYVISLMFDLTKAFDVIDSKLLKFKLYNIGIRGALLAWILSYMENRRLKVKLNGHESEIHNLVLGVPQGSVLGPLLFLLYINNVPENITSGHVTIFADDLTVTLVAHTLEELQAVVDKTMEEVSTWAQRDKLILNNSKTVFMNFTIQRPLPNNLIMYDNIASSQSTKLLGTYIDYHLLWDVHIKHVCEKLNKAFFAILQIRDSLDQTGLLNTYYALAYSHISYNIICWGSARDRDRVFICQKRIIRLIFKLNYNESCRDTFINKNILTTPCIFIYKCLTYVKKNMDLFVKRNQYHSYDTRNGELLSVPKHRTTNYEHSPKYNCIILYNSLPLELRNITNFIRYKRAVKELLVKGGFYSMNEYINRES